MEAPEIETSGPISHAYFGPASRRLLNSHKTEASGEQRGEGSLGKNGGAKAYDEGRLAIVGVKVRRFR